MEKLKMKSFGTQTQSKDMRRGVAAQTDAISKLTPLSPSYSTSRCDSDESETGDDGKTDETNKGQKFVGFFNSTPSATDQRRTLSMGSKPARPVPSRARKFYIYNTGD